MDIDQRSCDEMPHELPNGFTLMDCDEYEGDVEAWYTKEGENYPEIEAHSFEGGEMWATALYAREGQFENSREVTYTNFRPQQLDTELNELAEDADELIAERDWR